MSTVAPLVTTLNLPTCRKLPPIPFPSRTSWPVFDGHACRERSWRQAALRRARNAAEKEEKDDDRNDGHVK